MFGIHLVLRRMLAFLVDGRLLFCFSPVLINSEDCKSSLNTQLGSLCFILIYFNFINLLKVTLFCLVPRLAMELAVLRYLKAFHVLPGCS